MTRDQLLDDLTYARTLAEEGRHAPLLGGGYLVLFGALNLCAFSAQWGLLIGRLPRFDGAAFAFLWLSYGVLVGIGIAVLRLRTRDKPGLGAIGVRAERVIWSGAAMALGAVALGSILRMLLTHDTDAPNAIFGAAFALYGAALYATSKLSRQIWMTNFAWLSIAVTAALCVFANETWAYLIAAAGSVLVLLWPGLILMRSEPSAIV
jgi:hypothetical protein